MNRVKRLIDEQKFKRQRFFGGFWASKLHESFWIWQITMWPPPGYCICSSKLGQIGIVFISSTFKILPVIFKPIISREHIPDPGNRTGEVRNSKSSQTRDLYCTTLNANPPSLRGEKFGWKGTNFISMQLLLFFGIHDLQNVNPPLTSLNYRYTTVCHPFFKVRRSK